MSQESMEINFRQSMEVVRDLEELSGLLKRVTEEELEEMIRGMQGCWKGTAAEEFFKNSDGLRVKLNQSAATLAAKAQMVKRAAKNIYEAERQAIIVAEERKYR